MFCFSVVRMQKCTRYPFDPLLTKTWILPVRVVWEYIHKEMRYHLHRLVLFYIRHVSLILPGLFKQLSFFLFICLHFNKLWYRTRHNIFKRDPNINSFQLVLKVNKTKALVMNFIFIGYLFVHFSNECYNKMLIQFSTVSSISNFVRCCMPQWVWMHRSHHEVQFCIN